MTPRVREYDPQANGAGCYNHAIKIKHDRGDDYYLRAPLDHVPVTKAPRRWLLPVILFCAAVWAAVIAWVAA